MGCGAHIFWFCVELAHCPPPCHAARAVRHG
jgi:hypothetical protein